MSLQSEFEEEAELLITDIFGPIELPDSNKTAVFKKTVSSGYQQTIDSSFTVENLIRVEYTASEIRQKKIEGSDLRFIGIVKQFESEPTADNTTFTWNSIEYNVVKVDNVFNIIYDIQAAKL